MLVLMCLHGLLTLSYWQSFCSSMNISVLPFALAAVKSKFYDVLSVQKPQEKMKMFEDMFVSINNSIRDKQ